jgi:DNA-directed RNA polymerase subunit RPC12/RpoP
MPGKTSGSVRMVKVRCPHCGAEYEVPETVTYATCPYCGTTFKISNPEEKIEHFLYRMLIDKNRAYRLARDFATQQIGVAEDLADKAAFNAAKLYYLPIYIYSIDIKAPCKEEERQLEKEEEVEAETRELKLKVHGGEEAEYVIVQALDNPPIPVPENYGFPARARMYFKPSILKDGVYLQPLKDPMKVFEEVKRPSLEKAAEEGRISCAKGYDIIDNSRYEGIAHYPFWHITYSYNNKSYQAVVDAADGTIVYLEYPLSLRGRLLGITGGLIILLASSGIGAYISAALMGDLYPGLIGAALASTPAPAYTFIRLVRRKGKYLFKPGEEAVFLPVR